MTTHIERSTYRVIVSIITCGLAQCHSPLSDGLMRIARGRVSLLDNDTPLDTAFSRRIGEADDP